MLMRITVTAILLFVSAPAFSDGERRRAELGKHLDKRLMIEALAEPKPDPASPDKPVPTEVSVALPVTFEFASAELTSAGRSILQVAVEALQSPELKSTRFRVEGHTDAVGSSSANNRLSELRALAARDYLISKGVDPARLVYVGYGESRLIEGIDPNHGRNRRVEIVRLR